MCSLSENKKFVQHWTRYGLTTFCFFLCPFFFHRDECSLHGYIDRLFIQYMFISLRSVTFSSIPSHTRLNSMSLRLSTRKILRAWTLDSGYRQEIHLEVGRRFVNSAVHAQGGIYPKILRLLSTNICNVRTLSVYKTYRTFLWIHIM